MNTAHASQRVPRRRQGLYSTSFDRLETRLLFATGNTFAQLFGSTQAPNDTQDFAISLRAEEFVLRGRSTLLGFHVSPADGSEIDPAAIEILNDQGTAVGSRLTRHDISQSSNSLVLVKLPLGNYRLRTSGEGDSVGAFAVEVFLPGDLNGDGQVTGREIRAINRLGDEGNPTYVVEADANLDGQITSLDISAASANRRDATSVRKLTLFAHLEPPPVVLPNGELGANVPAAEIVGTSTAGTIVSLDANADGLFDDASVVVQPNGGFLIPVNLVEGRNVFAIRAADRFGQERFQTIEVTREPTDQTPPPPPAFDLDAASDSRPRGDRRTIFQSVTLVGRTEPGAQVMLQQTGAATVADQTGEFMFSNVQLAVGDNPFTARASDQHGNTSDFTATISRSAIAADAVVLHEGTNLVVESSVPIDLGVTRGSRTVGFNLDVFFDPTDRTPAIEDVFLAYLVDPTDPTQTLLDRGVPGTSIFMLADSDCSGSRPEPPPAARTHSTTCRHAGRKTSCAAECTGCRR